MSPLYYSKSASQPENPSPKLFKYYAIVSLHNINYNIGGFISNEIYFAARYSRFNDEILSMNRNITLKNRKKTKLLFLTNT